ncbi:putative nitronate monooxygenase [Sporobolomyces koalae]|uniref:putative nitronate monooxygenase n=1 Tax=Sporobolomyces koalae TaxID=500713 RepID=UPI0031742EEE
MANCCGGVLAAEVSKAGGLGLVGHAASLEVLQKEVDKGREHLGLNDTQALPFGVGLVLWKIEEPEVTRAEAATLSSSFLEYVATTPFHSIWLSFSPHLEEWVTSYRQAEARVGTGKRAFVFVMASRTEDTIAASEWYGVDAVVAQGTEAGGHGPSHELGMPLDKLLDKVSPHFSPSKSPFLLAAGGLSSATSIAAVVTRYPSVAGIVVGTAFTVATESLWTTSQKELVCRTVSADETDRGLEWDKIRNAMGWPAGVDGRAIRNRTRGRQDSVYGQQGKQGDGPNLDEVGTWAGTGVGEVRSIKPAAEILHDLASQL